MGIRIPLLGSEVSHEDSLRDRDRAGGAGHPAVREPACGGLRQRIVRHGYTREGYRVWKAGENIALGAGLSSSPVLIVDKWMKSSMHRAVILTKSFRDLGVGAVSDGTVWFFTLDLGRRVR